MGDYLVRGISDGANVVGLACVTTDLVERARKLHGTSRTASAALGRALTGGLLMGSLMKKGQRVALKFEGNGPLKKILVEADHEGTVRGFVGVPEAEVPFKDEKLNVSGALGSRGVLTVIKDLGLKEPYQGIVELLSGEIGEDLAFYYSESENIRKIPVVTGFLRLGKTPEDLLAELFSGLPYHTLGKKDLFFRCSCSQERVEKILVALGGVELAKMIHEQGEAEVTCEYCRTRYHFTRQQLEDLLSEARQPGDA